MIIVQSIGNGPPFRRSAIPKVRHSEGPVRHSEVKPTWLDQRFPVYPGLGLGLGLGLG